MNHSTAEKTLPTATPPATPGGADASLVATEVQRLRFRALVRTCPLFQGMEEQAGTLTLNLSAEGLGPFEQPQTPDTMRQPAKDVLEAASTCGFKSIVLVFPENVRGLGENTAALIVSLHKNLRTAFAQTTITLRSLPGYFRDRLRTHGFQNFLTIESGTEKAGG